MVETLNVTLKQMTPKLTATMDQMQGILKRADLAMANIQSATASASRLASNPRIEQTMNAVMADLRDVSEDARRTAKVVTAELRATVRRNTGRFDELAEGAVELLQRLADTVDAARGTLTKLTEQVSDPRLQQSLLETVDLARATLARFNQIASDIHSLTGDPGVQTDIKSTVSSLKETTEETGKLVKRIGSLVETLQPGKSPRLGVGKPEINIDMFARTQTPRFRSDIGVRLPIGEENAFHLGLYDFPEANRLNAQYETVLKGRGALRYGLYAGKLGVGLDWGAAEKSRFRLDAYDPNDLRLDAKALIRLNPDFSVWAGADNIFKRTTPLVGIRLTR
jgi:phospholipid/cholesterol/gamma-HCH transport system substrate-binding protein